MIRFETKHYSINDFREWDSRGELVLTPKFQRRSVWSDKARSYLLDTVLRGFPISKVFMRHDVDPKTKKSIREIIDGQQRISAILNFINDGFKVSKIHNKNFGGNFFSELPLDMQRDILRYEISVDVLLGAADFEVLDMFARLNTYTVQLNKQELRNAKWFGLFKKTAFSLGYEYVDFWQKNKVLTAHQIARMGEAELASELVIFLLDGIKDRKKIDDYYKNYDSELKNRKKIMLSFRHTMDVMSELTDGYLKQSNFSSTHLFYTLFCVLTEVLNLKKLQPKDYPKIMSVMQKIDGILNSDPDDISSSDYKFYDAFSSHVTDLKARRTRHNYMKKMIIGALSKK